ncbi:hypothetical protein ACLN6N_16290 (plasmid) [Sphingomonas carotinifaciens]|uniref:hypothetical protein n=1 Tax=Sphingomonas carotinifaciens TaxID=1166323 RepID=UPI0039A10844
MDLNYLLHRHQVSLMRSNAAGSPEARHAHNGLVRGYAYQISELTKHARDGLRPLVAL